MSIPTKPLSLTETETRPTEVTVHLEPGVATRSLIGGREVPAGAPGTTPPGADHETDADMAALVRDAATHLGPRTMALIDLSVVQGLPDSEVGARVGIRADIVSVTVARTRERVAEALAIYVLVKTRTRACPELRRVVGAHARASLEAHMAEAVAGHVDECPECAEAWRRIPPPLEVLPQSRPRQGRESIRDLIRRWTIKDRPVPRLRAIQAAGAVAVIVVGLGVVTILGGGGEPNAEAIPDGRVVSDEGATPNPESVNPASIAGTATRKQPRPTIAAAPEPTVAAEPQPATPRPTTTMASPSEPPLVTIISPFNGQVFTAPVGQQRIDLVAVVQDDVDDRLEVDWYEGNTYLGTGNAITVTSADVCVDSMTHTVTATVTDSSGNTSTEQTSFTIVCDA